MSTTITIEPSRRISAPGTLSTHNQAKASFALLPPVISPSDSTGASITLTWLPLFDVDHFKVYRSASSEGETPIATLAALSFTEWVPGDSQTHSYVVTAMRGAGQSADSNVAVHHAGTGVVPPQGYEGDQPTVTVKVSQASGEASKKGYEQFSSEGTARRFYLHKEIYYMMSRTIDTTYLLRQYDGTYVLSDAFHSETNAWRGAFLGDAANVEIDPRTGDGTSHPVTMSGSIDATISYSYDPSVGNQDSSDSFHSDYLQSIGWSPSLPAWVTQYDDMQPDVLSRTDEPIGTVTTPTSKISVINSTLVKPYFDFYISSVYDITSMSESHVVSQSWTLYNSNAVCDYRRYEMLDSEFTDELLITIAGENVDSFGSYATSLNVASATLTTDRYTATVNNGQYYLTATIPAFTGTGSFTFFWTLNTPAGPVAMSEVVTPGIGDTTISTTVHTIAPDQEGEWTITV